jgi:hypothetical protein
MLSNTGRQNWHSPTALLDLQMSLFLSYLQACWKSHVICLAEGKKMQPQLNSLYPPAQLPAKKETRDNLTEKVNLPFYKQCYLCVYKSMLNK